MTFNESTTRDVLQMDIGGLEEMLTTLSTEIKSNAKQLTNFDANAFAKHLKAAAKVLQNATGA